MAGLRLLWLALLAALLLTAASPVPRATEIRYLSDFQGNTWQLQGVVFRPVAAKGPVPGVVLVPGFNNDAWTEAPLGRYLAEHGYLVLSVSMMGFGKSPGNNAFVGPATVAGVGAGVDYLKSLPGVDSRRVGIWGNSRGAIAAALLAAQRDDLRAVVCQSGAYDIKRAYQGLKQWWIRANIQEEMGTSDEAFRQRSAVLQADRISAPVLLLHGERDDRIPVEQARLMEAALRRLGKVVDAYYYPRADHDLPERASHQRILAFLERYLRPEPPAATPGQP